MSLSLLCLIGANALANVPSVALLEALGESPTELAKADVQAFSRPATTVAAVVPAPQIQVQATVVPELVPPTVVNEPSVAQELPNDGEIAVASAEELALLAELPVVEASAAPTNLDATLYDRFFTQAEETNATAPEAVTAEPTIPFWMWIAGAGGLGGQPRARGASVH